MSIEQIIKVASFRNQYDLLSNNVARKIFEAIKGNFLTKTNIRESFSEGEYTIDFSLKFNNSYDKKINIKSDFYYPVAHADPFIDVKIYLRTDLNKQDFERLYWDLYESIRHEYEHFDKYLRGFWPDTEYNKTMESLGKLNLSDTEKVNLVFKYILDPIEIDSYAKSIMYVAKKRKTPYGNVIDDVLNRAVFNNDEKIKERMTKDEEINRTVKEIKDKLVKRIQEVFPAVVLSNSF